MAHFSIEVYLGQVHTHTHIDYWLSIGLQLYDCRPSASKLLIAVTKAWGLVSMIDTHLFFSRTTVLYRCQIHSLRGTTASIAPLIPMWIELIKSSRVLRFNQHRASGTGFMLPGPQFTKRTAVLTLNSPCLERWLWFRPCKFKHNLTLQWHHNEHDGVSNRLRLDYLLKRLVRYR